MSKSESTPQSEEDEFRDERLDTASKNRRFKKALKENQNEFKSFSEGLEAVDKFDIVDKTADKSKDSDKIMEGESFDSFSHGLTSVDKFDLSGVDPDDLEIKEFKLSDYLKSDYCPFNKNKISERSRTVSELSERLFKCSWLDEVRIFLHAKEYPCEYDHRNQNIHLDQTREENQQLLDLVHQIYHVAHRYFKKLYGDAPVSREVFVDTFIWSEAGALLAELNVKNDLDIEDSYEIGFKLITNVEGSLKNEYLEPVLNEGGLDRLRLLLTNSILRDDFVNKQTLVSYLNGYHAHYQSTFDNLAPLVKALISETSSNGIPVNKI